MIDALDFAILRALAKEKKEKNIILNLLKKRMIVVQKLAAHKKEYGIPPFDLEREAYIFKIRKAYGRKIGLSDEDVKHFFCDVLKYSHKVINRIFQKKTI